MQSSIVKFKPIFKPSKINPNIKLCDLKSKNSLLGDITLFTQEHGRNNDFFITQVLDANKNKLGEEIFSISDSPRSMFGFNISVIQELRKCGAKLGELLRLSSIIEMIENNTHSIDIMSKGSAVFFHSKYKFEPNIKNFDHATSALIIVIRNCEKKYPELAKEAKRLLDIFDKEEYGHTLRQARDNTNELLKKYIEIISKDKNNIPNQPFIIGFDMTLTKDSVMDNKDFFNELFTKHGVDYTV